MTDIAATIQAAVIKERMAEATKRGPTRAASNHASQLAHPCWRKLFYDRTSAHLRPKPSVRAAFTWELGKLTERWARHELERVGYDVIAPQREFRLEAENIVGSVDGLIAKDGWKGPVEIKSISGNDWPSLTSIEAMTNSSKWWHRVYPGQLNMYMYLAKDEYPQGLFYLKCKQTGQARALLMDFDYDLADRCLKAAEAVEIAVADNEPPDRMPFSAKICGMCDYREVVCGPPQPPRPRVTDAEILAFLAEHERLKEFSSKYTKSQARLKEYFPEEAVVMAGPFEVTVTKNKKGTLMRRVRNLLETEEEE